MTNQSQPRVLNNRFQLERKLGQGGMATVYLARDLRLNRPVAVKVLHGQYANDEQFLRRFKHEADAVAQLGHPNIVRVYDVGNDGDVHYIVMEYIAGSDLKEIITLDAPLPVGRTLKIVQQIAEALEVAHRSGLVHRDVKPQNVLMDSEDRVHLSDFGIAKSDRSSAYTDPGTTFGTADYLAPEQGQGLGATPRSDIYALGIVTYEMLTGRLPFTGDNPLAVAMQHVQATPPPPRQYNPAIPAQLEAIILSAMAKDPNQRPPSARAFAEQLRTYRDRGDQPTVASPTVARPPAAQAVPGRPDAPTVINPVEPPRTPRPVAPPRPAAQLPPRSERGQQYRNVPPPLVPQPAFEQPVPARRSGGCGFFIVGLLLLAGIGGLLYALFFTELVPTLQQAFGGSSSPPTAAPVEPTAPSSEPTAQVELVAVPPLVGLSEQQALEQLAALGFREFRKPPQNNPASPATVIEQEIAPTTLIAKGSVVSFTLSLGPLQVDVPDVTRQQADAATANLQAAGFQVQRADAPDAAVPAGFVISQNPPTGVKLGQGSTIEIVVSRGDVVQFPSVIGLSRAEAEAIFSARSDLKLDLIDEQGPDRLANFESYAPNQVVSATANDQPVENGTFVPRGSLIILGVRKP